MFISCNIFNTQLGTSDKGKSYVCVRLYEKSLPPAHLSCEPQVGSVQLLSNVQLFATPWTAAPDFPVDHQLLELTSDSCP